MDYREQLKDVKRIVIKVGTTTLTHSTGKLNIARTEQLVRQIVDLKHQGKDVVLVSSGAIGTGMGRLNLTERPKTIVERQALAAIGQGLLMQIYEKFFGEYGEPVAQVLLTKSDISERERYLNARNTLLALLGYGAIPIINENDTVATDELKIGENDGLSALVSGLIDADLLILMSDIDGLYTADPHKDENAKLIDCVPEITKEIKAMAGGSSSMFGTGGMLTKINAAQIATSSGSMMALINGENPLQIQQLLQGESVGTIFLSKNSAVNHRKRWIACGPKPTGSLVIDSGAENALLKQGKSLLPSGITEVSGNFGEGALVKIFNSEGNELARGFSNYSSEHLLQIMGKKTTQIETILGFKNSDEAIHRDNLVLL